MRQILKDAFSDNSMHLEKNKKRKKERKEQGRGGDAATEVALNLNQPRDIVYFFLIIILVIFFKLIQSFLVLLFIHKSQLMLLLNARRQVKIQDVVKSVEQNKIDSQQWSP